MRIKKTVLQKQSIEPGIGMKFRGERGLLEKEAHGFLQNEVLPLELHKGILPCTPLVLLKFEESSTLSGFRTCT